MEGEVGKASPFYADVSNLSLLIENVDPQLVRGSTGQTADQILADFYNHV